MSQSTRFSVAIHILVALTLRKADRLTSEELAWSIDTNASMVRRILTSLNRAGLVSSHAGPAGGAVLDKDPKRISLLDVLLAVELKPSSGVHTPNPECPLGAVLEEPLCAVLTEAEKASQRVLSQKTVREVATTIGRRVGRTNEPAARSRAAKHR